MTYMYSFEHRYPKLWHLWDLTSLVVHAPALGVELPSAAIGAI